MSELVWVGSLNCYIATIWFEATPVRDTCFWFQISSKSRMRSAHNTHWRIMCTAQVCCNPCISLILLSEFMMTNILQQGSLMGLPRRGAIKDKITTCPLELKMNICMHQYHWCIGGGATSLSRDLFEDHEDLKSMFVWEASGLSRKTCTFASCWLSLCA